MNTHTQDTSLGLGVILAMTDVIASPSKATEYTKGVQNKDRWVLDFLPGRNLDSRETL